LCSFLFLRCPDMSYVVAQIELGNPKEPDLVPVKTKALADTGTLMLCIPDHLALQLKLETESVREVSLADGRHKNVPYVEPIRVSFGNRFCYVGALVLGDEVLLGTVPMGRYGFGRITGPERGYT